MAFLYTNKVRFTEKNTLFPLSSKALPASQLTRFTDHFQAIIREQQNRADTFPLGSSTDSWVILR